MALIVLSIFAMDSTDILIAAGFGACCTLLMALRKGRPLSTVIGWALAGFGMGFYCGAKLAKAFGLKEEAGAFVLSVSSGLWIPWASSRLPKWLDQQVGVAIDNDPNHPADDSGEPSLSERADTSHGSESMG